MARSGGQWQGQRYAVAGVLACALLGWAPLAAAADGDTVASAAIVVYPPSSGASDQTRAPAILETPALAIVAYPSSHSAADQTRAQAVPESPDVPEHAAPAQDLTQSLSGPGEGPDNSARPGSEGILALHSDIKFSFVSAPRQTGDQSAQAVAFAEQVKRLAGVLQIAARGLYPDAVKRIGAFDVYVGNSNDLAALSSGSGKIVINSGFARASTPPTTGSPS